MDINYNLPDSDKDSDKIKKPEIKVKKTFDRDLPKDLQKFPKLAGVDKKVSKSETSLTAKIKKATKKLIAESPVIIKNPKTAKALQTDKVENLFVDQKKPTEKKLFSELTPEEKKQMTTAKLKALKSIEEGDWWANQNIAIIPEEGQTYDRSVLPYRPNMRIYKACGNCKYSVRPYCIKSNRAFCKVDAVDAPKPVEFGLADVDILDLRWKDMILYAETVGWYPVQLHLGCDKWEENHLIKKLTESITGRAFNDKGEDDPTLVPDYNNRILRSRVDYCFKVYHQEDKAGNPGEPKTLERVNQSTKSTNNTDKSEKKQ